jgi:membrane protease YdiL (CAAX protease family)
MSARLHCRAVDGVALAALLVAYSNTLNLWPPFNGPAYVPLNVALAAVLFAVALGPLDLDAGALGLADPEPFEILAAMAAGMLICVPLFVAVARRRGLSVVADERVKGLWGASLLYQALVRVPLGTALVEELAFRGVLLAVWRDLGDVTAVVGSSVAFGLWHVSPTINLLRANRPNASSRRLITTVLGAVLVTTLAGIALALLRLETNSLHVPLAVHATVNSLATVAGAVAHRRKAQEA